MFANSFPQPNRAVFHGIIADRNDGIKFLCWQTVYVFGFAYVVKADLFENFTSFRIDIS
jgi:hypothetical protein